MLAVFCTLPLNCIIFSSSYILIVYVSSICDLSFYFSFYTFIIYMLEVICNRSLNCVPLECSLFNVDLFQSAGHIQ